MDVEILKKINSLAKTLHSQGLASNMDDANRLASCMVGTKHNDVDEFSSLARTQMSGERKETKENDDTLSNGGMVVGPKRTFADERHPTINEQMMSGTENMVAPAYTTGVMPQPNGVAQMSAAQPAPAVPAFDFTKIKYEIEGKVSEVATKVSEVETHSNNNFTFIKQIGDEIDKINDKLRQIERKLSELNNAPARSSSSSEQSAAPREQSQPQPSGEAPKEAPREQANARTGDNKPGDFDIRKYFYSGSDK